MPQISETVTVESERPVSSRHMSLHLLVTTRTPAIYRASAGAGAGTLVVLLANALPDTSPWKPWILFAAPTVAVTIGGLSTWAIGRLIAYVRARSLASELAQARKAVEKGLQTTGTSPRHKAEIRKSLEELQRIEIDNNMNRVRLLASQQQSLMTSTTEDGQS